MINNHYRNIYQALFRELLDASARGELDACGIPSYTHPNKLMSWLFWKRISTALKMCKDVSGKRVLDFGCGAGVCFKFLSEKGCQIIACDIQYHSVANRIAKALGLPITAYANIEHIPEATFDYILALDVLEHVEDVASILQVFKKMSHASTQIIVSGPTENLFYRFGRFLAGFSGDYHHRSIYDVERALIDSGFALNKMRKLFIPVPLFRISSWNVAKE